MKSVIIVFFICSAIAISVDSMFVKPTVKTQSEYIDRQILQELEEVNENLKEIKELEGRIIDRLR